jgi:hypothetical protein
VFKFSQKVDEITLPIAGQGVFLFEHADISKSCTFCFSSTASCGLDNRTSGSTGALNVEFAQNSVSVKKDGEQLADPENKGLGCDTWHLLLVQP